MRVIAGTLRGRQFHSPSGHKTHPMSEKARGGLFNVLGDIDDLSILDAFAGTGALSFEAVSRGATSVVAIDADKHAHRTLSDNILALGLGDKIKAVHANASSWSDNNRGAKFDLVIAAPPYDNLQISLVKKLTRHVTPKGLFILDWPSSKQAPLLDNLQQITDKLYGDAMLVFYR